MKLSNRNMVLVSFMLFSLFFGAGNLIFPPFLGQNAGSNTIPAMVGFILTAVVLPVLGVIVVAQSDGLDKLANRVGQRFSLIFTVLIYLSIGPGLAIPRAASVPFEMAVAPYLAEDANRLVFMLLYSLVFFLIALWMCLNPGKLLENVGAILTPVLLILLVLLFVSFVFHGEVSVAPPQSDYLDAPFLQGFCVGYQTMDTIAALNFGLIIAVTLRSFGIEKKKDIVHYTLYAGVLAGAILALVYIMLAYMGVSSSGVYAIGENGAQTLRQIVAQLFGEFGAVILAAIFALACLTTCVGLISSIAQYFSGLFKKISYRKWVLIITAFSFLICNQGLTTILSISVPILDAIYPVSIVLILLSLVHRYISSNAYIYPFTIAGVAVVSILYSLDHLHVLPGAVHGAIQHLPFFSLGFGWVCIAVIMIILSYVVNTFRPAHS